MKKITTFICALAMMANAASLISHAENEGFALGSDGVVYSLEMDIIAQDDVPVIGEAQIDSVWLSNAMEIFPDAEFAVEIQAFVMSEAFSEEETKFMEEHFIDGKSYAEFLKEVSKLNYPDLSDAEKEKLQKVKYEKANYMSSLIDKQRKHEAEWLTENGIEILNRSGNSFYYAVVSKEQLENFPVSTTTGYKVFLTRTENIPEASLEIESAVSGKMLYGDFNNDGNVNASDAADSLVYSSAAGAGKASALSSSSVDAADVNGDENIDAADAAAILQFASEVGSGNYSGTLEEYMKGTEK